LEFRRNRAIAVLHLLVFEFVSGRGMAATFFGPRPYLSSADIPDGLYNGGLPSLLPVRFYPDPPVKSLAKVYQSDV
jgi:hypothetical protein